MRRLLNSAVLSLLAVLITSAALIALAVLTGAGTGDRALAGSMHPAAARSVSGGFLGGGFLAGRSISGGFLSGRFSTGRFSGAAPAGRYRPPVSGGVLRGFSPPATRYGAGHLGVDLAAGPGTVVSAAGSGVVRFAGLVAGRGVVVIAHPDGISTEYEPLAVTVPVGVTVVTGQPIGRLAGPHRGCPPAGCLHWGARRNGQYLDPMGLLQPLGVVRLLPWDWVPPR